MAAGRQAGDKSVAAVSRGDRRRSLAETSPGGTPRYEKGVALRPWSADVETALVRPSLGRVCRGSGRNPTVLPRAGRAESLRPRSCGLRSRDDGAPPSAWIGSRR
jgi:hypothetical protein